MKLTCSMCGDDYFTLTLKAGGKAAKRGVWSVDCATCEWGIKIAVGGKSQ